MAIIKPLEVVRVRFALLECETGYGSLELKYLDRHCPGTGLEGGCVPHPAIAMPHGNLRGAGRDRS